MPHCLFCVSRRVRYTNKVSLGVACSFRFRPFAFILSICTFMFTHTCSSGPGAQATARSPPHHHHHQSSDRQTLAQPLLKLRRTRAPLAPATVLHRQYSSTPVCLSSHETLRGEVQVRKEDAHAPPTAPHHTRRCRSQARPGEARRAYASSSTHSRWADAAHACRAVPHLLYRLPCTLGRWPAATMAIAFGEPNFVGSSRTW